MSIDQNTPKNITPGKRSGIYISRRIFLLGGTFFVLGAGVLIGAGFTQSTLKALVDTIIPKDEFGPAASETGAVEAVLAAVRGSTRKEMLLRMALLWLNVKSGGSFAAAGESKRVALLTEIGRRPGDDLFRRFYEKVRTLTMRHYYGDAERAKALGFVGPPQPGGHPEPSAAWKQQS